MGKRGSGYGSEDHLRRYLAERPREVNVRVAQALDVNTNAVRWLDFPKTATGDREFRGLEFLPLKEFGEIRARWKTVWPSTGRQPSWDAIGRVGDAWVLVEAKANAPEFASPPCAASPDAHKRIVKALNATKRQLDVNRFYPWDGTYYQYANRLTTSTPTGSRFCASSASRASTRT